MESKNRTDNDVQAINWMLLIVLSIGLVWPVEASLTEGLTAHWAFEGNALDVNRNGIDAIVYGAQSTTDRFVRTDQAYLFDGIDAFMDIGNSVKPVYRLSVALWVKCDSLNPAAIFRNDQF